MTMEGLQPTPKLSLNSLVSNVLPSLDVNISTTSTTRKHKRVRQTAATPGDTNATSSTAGAAQSIANSTMPTSTSTSISTVTKTMITPAPTTFLISDMAVAAAAVFALPTPSTTPSPMLKAEIDATPESTTTVTKKKRKNKKRKSNQKQLASAESPGVTTSAAQPAKPVVPAAASQGASDHKKVNKNNKRKHSQNTHGYNQDERKSKMLHKNTQKYVRGLDARPELVGVSKEDDFSTLLLKHVEHSNKILQRDLEVQSKKMMEDQKRQAELLASQAALLANPGVSAQDMQKPGSEARRNQRSHQQNKTQEKTTFVPRKDCLYFLKGHCVHGATCTFKHDVEAQKTALAEAERENKKTRGVCKYAISGSCTNGDQCPYSHDLKEQPCAFFHLYGKCDSGEMCRFGHSPITQDQLDILHETFRKKADTLHEVEPKPAGVDLSLYGTKSVSAVTTSQTPAVSQGAQEQAVPDTVSGDKRSQVCKFEIAGSCNKGELCSFSHDLSQQPCGYFHVFGKCEKGPQCRFGHSPITAEQLEATRDFFQKRLALKRENETMAVDGQPLLSQNPPPDFDLSMVHSNMMAVTEPPSYSPVPDNAQMQTNDGPDPNHYGTWDTNHY
ncbi:hypothetical protein BGX28_005193 [Mortierella sp. GBA30]|nr:hypothetical protein BGX28_005193 [Mortierella sp. GBA30]